MPKQLTDYPQVGFCPECGEAQYKTPSGTCCGRGHDGLPTLEEKPAQIGLTPEKMQKIFPDGMPRKLKDFSTEELITVLQNYPWQNLGRMPPFQGVVVKRLFDEIMRVRDLMVDREGLQDMIARAMHDRWRELRIKEKGWHAPEDCPRRHKPHCAHCDHKQNYRDREGDNQYKCIKGNSVNLRYDGYVKNFKCDEFQCGNCHTCVRPWDELTATEQELPLMNAAIAISIISKTFGGQI